MAPVKKIRVDMNEAQLGADLENYRQKALDLGASSACIVRAEQIPVDERIPMKCQIPRCFGYGSSAQCPPNTMKPAELRELLKKYEWAVFFIKDIPSEIIVRDKATADERIKEFHHIFTVVSEIESAAFYDGHYLAFGFASGSCRHNFCAKLPECQALKGLPCKFPLKSRPSMEAVGIDVFKMVALAGWDIYPIGSGARAQDVPKGTLAGIVIVQ
jgi:predicted metal-binding protein